MRGIVCSLALLICSTVGGLAADEPVSPAVLHEIAPTQHLRAAINLGSSVLASRNGAELTGISVNSHASSVVTDAIARNHQPDAALASSRGKAP